jgi:putative transposase
MKSSRFTEEQIIGILKQAEAGVKMRDLCHQHGISDHTYYRWKPKHGGYGGLRSQEAESPGGGEPPAQAATGGERAGPSGIEDRLIKKVLTRPPLPAAVAAMQTAGVSQRKACSLVGIWRGTCRYQARSKEEEDLLRQLLHLTFELLQPWSPVPSSCTPCIRSSPG